MIQWLIRVLWGCTSSECKFVRVKETAVFSDAKDPMPTSHIYVLQCEKCGRMKNHRV